ncbi:MAG: GGDEF domain-containing protein, partial [Spirochaetota bacterium]
TAYILFVSVLSIAANYIGKHQLNQLQEHAIRDHLTGLFNRRYFDATIEHEISRAQNKETKLGVILMDIDAFKKYNDNFGHDAGDLLLQTIGTFVLDEIRLSDIVCRYGGDEFALLIPNADRKTISELAERLRIEAKQIDITYQGKPLGSISISQGIAVFPENGTTRDELMTHADAALFRAKEGGRDAISN